jgi:DNA-binding IclR family transcriptional regulator
MSTNQSLDRGLAILTLLDGQTAAMGIREIARALDLSPTIVQRLANTLMQADFLEQVAETRRYRLGYRAVLLGSLMRREDPLLATSTAELNRLAETHRLNGYLGALREGGLLYLNSVQSSGPITVRTTPGSRAHAHSTAMGKALLAELAPEAAAAVLGAPPFPRLTDATITDPERLADELAAVRRRGYALAREENLPGVISIGAVIRDMSDRAVAAISVAFLASEHPEADWPAIAQLVLEATHRCSRALGHAGAPIRLSGATLDAA